MVKILQAKQSESERQGGKGHLFGYSLTHQSLNTGLKPFVAKISFPHQPFSTITAKSPRLALLDIRITILMYFIF